MEKVAKWFGIGMLPALLFIALAATLNSIAHEDGTIGFPRAEAQANPNTTVRSVVAETGTGPVLVSIAPGLDSWLYRASIALDTPFDGANTAPITVSIDSARGAAYSHVLLSQTPTSGEYWSYSWSPAWFLEAGDTVILEYANRGPLFGATLVVGNRTFP